jgi:ABC-type tungstate transport system permease subunit
MGRSRADSEGVRRLFACLLVAAVLPAAASARSGARSVVVEGPAALAESGFVRAVLVPVARRHGITVRYVSSDGARALSDLRAGKANLALSDSEAAGTAFIAAKASLEPTGRLVLYGDDVLVGPAADPAGVAKGAPQDIAAALRLVATAGRAGRADFVAGGIGHDELALWQAAKVMHGEQAVPVGERWYHYGATDPAAVVRSASACAFASRRCYALVDRGVLRQVQGGRNGLRARGLRVLVAHNGATAAGGTAALAHPVRAYVTPRAGSAARTLLTLLTSAAIQQATDAYPTRKAPVYHAAATPLLLIEQGVPDLEGRLTEGTPGGSGLVGVRLRLLVERSGHAPVLLATVRTGDDGSFTASARVDASRKLSGTLVLRSDPARGQSAGNFAIGRMG